MGKVGLLDQPGGGVWPNPNFLAKFPKTKFALQLSINVMKHTLHKWGGNISSIHNVIGPPKKITARLGKKKRKKLGQFPSEGGGFPCPNFFLKAKGEKTEKNGKSWANSQARGGGVPLSQPKKTQKMVNFHEKNKLLRMV